MPTLSGTNTNYLINVLFATAGAEPTAAKIKQIRQAIGEISTTTSPATQKMGDFERALRRAVIVAPMWMATRAAIKAVTDFIGDGVRNILELEKAMHNVTSTMQDFGKNGKQNLEELAESFSKLAIESGKAESSVANAFAGVNRVLQDREKSMIVTQEATKLSVETGADAAKLAETMAMLYKLQGDSLKGLTTDTEKFQAISTLLYVTQAKTPGGMEKLISDIKSLQATMNVADFGIENFIRLSGAMEAAGVSNSMALRTGLLRVLSDLDDASTMLGISFPANATSAEKFLAILERLNIAMTAPGDKSGVLLVLKDLFGSVIRGGTNLGSLAKDIDSVREALAGKGVTEAERNLQLEQLKAVTAEADHQVEVFKVLRNQSARVFMTGVLHGKDFASAMKSVNEFLEKHKALWEDIGRAVSFSPVLWIWDKLSGHKKIQEEINTVVKKQVDTEKQLTEQKIKQNKVQSDSLLMTKKQAQEVEDLLLQYEKATPEERPALKRKIELSQMSPENQMFAFTTSKEDRALLLEMASKLEDDVKKAMAGVISFEQGIYTQGRFSPFLTKNRPENGGLAETGTRLISYNPKAADQIAINITVEGNKTIDETVKAFNDQILKELLANEEFQKMFGKKIVNKLPEK